MTSETPARRPAGAHPDRAPRLRPDQLLADSMTRVGRFARIDPKGGRDLPTLVRVVGAVAWAALIGESFRRAWRARSVEGETAHPAARQPPR